MEQLIKLNYCGTIPISIHSIQYYVSSEYIKGTLSTMDFVVRTNLYSSIRRH